MYCDVYNPFKLMYFTSQTNNLKTYKILVAITKILKNC